MALLLVLACSAAEAAEVSLIGVIGHKAAVLAADGGDPKTVKIGQHWNGVTVLEVNDHSATIERDGKQLVLPLSPHYRRADTPSDRSRLIVAADERGHFFIDGAVNGAPMRFLVDTGASMVMLSSAHARRLGLRYEEGPLVRVQTANGPAGARFVILDRVRIGPIELNGVDGLVSDQAAPTALLGMSFLNRIEMRREGDSMTLIRRF
ncbi:MAG: TIGR02281 family clan AA aspartic protease [Burkholderiales bacterium]